MKYSIISITDFIERKEEAAEWFGSKWGVPKEAYLDSMDAAQKGESRIPAWYLAISDEGRIVGGLGVIENDFHNRPDLTPNVCAVYTEADVRGRGIAGTLLNFAVRDMHSRGIDTLYLLTDHTSFYERYGWEFFTYAMGDGESHPSRMYVHKYHLEDRI